MAADDSYPREWRPGGAKSPTSPDEAVALAIDSYIAALTRDEFDQLVARTRPGGR